ncbi:hypothetical protein ACWD1Y_03590 [Streptomyces sp. NPDC002814]
MPSTENQPHRDSPVRSEAQPARLGPVVHGHHGSARVCGGQGVGRGAVRARRDQDVGQQRPGMWGGQSDPHMPVDHRAAALQVRRRQADGDAVNRHG